MLWKILLSASRVNTLLISSKALYWHVMCNLRQALTSISRINISLRVLRRWHRTWLNLMDLMKHVEIERQTIEYVKMIDVRYIFICRHLTGNERLNYNKYAKGFSIKCICHRVNAVSYLYVYHWKAKIKDTRFFYQNQTVILVRW